ncbi:hypothetical protein DP939_44205 [Spongiactinospora rosea]|uniref:RNA polymerase sigma factor 70 region 4 type 2 domain-containing protein n=1 Tax=Spongiactinospora rosea TaxID=2248750 RepID=A0A366LE91_9ACTN|nr:sigma factor-like helix-turn-helix DNA-binding protein [Spongiactinospora rosea]RBQ12198.1 hypothetical protein DP939_44205 [Spongiactinospora rosea]
MSESFEAFFRKDYIRLIAFVVSCGFTADEAEEAAQEAMVAVFRRWTYVAEPQAYVRLTARRLAVQRRQREQQGLSLAMEATWAGARPHAQSFHPEPDVDHYLAIVRRLPERQRHVFAWYLEGFSHSQIAKIEQMPEATVRSHLRHAKDRLAQWFRPGTEKGDEP